jgi:hypothetical protein
MHSSISSTRSTSHEANDAVTTPSTPDPAQHEPDGNETALGADRVHVAVAHRRDRHQRPPQGVPEGLDLATAPALGVEDRE